MTLACLFIKIPGHNEVSVVDNGDAVIGTRDMLVRSLRDDFFAKQVDTIRSCADGSLEIVLDKEAADARSCYNMMASGDEEED